MNRKILSFLLSLIFLFDVPAIAYSKRVSDVKDTDTKTSQALEKSTINNTLSKTKNNIGSIIYKAITAGIVLVDLYLIYALFFKNNPNQQQNIPDCNVDNNLEQQPQQPLVSVHSEVSTTTDDIIENIDYAPIHGVRNTGNTCYMNAVIQQLYRNNKFRNHILRQRDISKVNCPFTWSIYHIFRSIKNNIQMSTDQMQECLQMIGHDGRQQDTDEHMRLIVDGCSKEVNRGQNIIDISNSAYAVQSDTSDYLIDIIKLGAPISADNVRQRIRNAHPHLQEGSAEFIRLQDEEFANPNPDNHAPPVIHTNNGTEIIIPINRTAQGEGFIRRGEEGHIEELRNDSKLSIPFKINLERDFNIQDNNRVYTLSCATIHLGNSGRAGHYIVYEKSADRKWYEINDSSVEEVQYANIKPIIERSSTILTYTLSDTSEQEPPSNINLVKDNPERWVRLKKFFRIK